MRPIHLARLDKVRPAVVMTRPEARMRMGKITVVPISSTHRGLPGEVPVGTQNGLEDRSFANCDNIQTIETADLGRFVGWFRAEQEKDLATAMRRAFGLVPPD